MNAAPGEPLWAADSTGFDIREWDDGAVLYVLATAETHAVGPAHGATLGAMLDYPGTSRTASQWLRLMSEVEPETDMTTVESAESAESAEWRVLSGALADLQAIGVVQRSPA